MPRSKVPTTLPTIPTSHLIEELQRRVAAQQGAAIAVLRCIMGWTVTDLARLVRVSPAHVSNIENGRSAQGGRDVWFRLLRKAKKDKALMAGMAKVHTIGDGGAKDLSDILFKWKWPYG